MSDFHTIITSPQFEDMLNHLSFWAFAFIIVFAITFASGLTHNILKTTSKKMKKVDDSIVVFANRIQKKEGPVTDKDVVAFLRRILKTSGKIERNLSVYQYDHPEDGEIGTILAQMKKVKTCCLNATALLSEKKIDNVPDQLLLVFRVLNDGMERIDKLQKRIYREKLLKL